MSMTFKHKTLEDIFIELTKDYVAPKKKKMKENQMVTKEDIDREIEALESIKNEGQDAMKNNDNEEENN